MYKSQRSLATHMLILQCVILIILALPAWAADDVSPDPQTQDTTPANTDTQSSEQETPASDSESQNKSTSRELATYVTPDKSKQRMAEVIRYLKTYQRENEIIEMSGKDGPMAGLYLPENTGKPQGGVLILHDIAQHAQWPNTVTPVREYLPDYGWNTLSIFFDQYIQKPKPEVKPIQNEPPVIANEEPALDPDAQTSTPVEGEVAQEVTNENNIDIEAPIAEEDPLDAEPGDELAEIASNLDEIPEFQPQISQEILEQPAIPIEETFTENMILRVEEGLNKLNELGQYNVVIIANGYSANWAAKLLEERLSGNNMGYALILIDAKSSEYPLIDLNDSLSKLDIPMLDIVTDHSPENLYSIKIRKGAMLRNQNKQYMQLYLPAIKPYLTQTNNMISRRIRGWLLTHAAGEEIAVKEKANY
jgi:hypothetical protein